MSKVISNTYPDAFLKSEGDIVIASVRLSIMHSPPKPLYEIQPNLVCELLCNCKKMAPPPGALGRG